MPSVRELEAALDTLAARFGLAGQARYEREKRDFKRLIYALQNRDLPSARHVLLSKMQGPNEAIREARPIRYLHTMLRVQDLDRALEFFVDRLGLLELNRSDNAEKRYTTVFVGTGTAGEADIELTYNWDREEAYSTGDFFGHIAFYVDDIYATCERLEHFGVKLERPPHDGQMAMVRSPDGHMIELLQW